MWGGLYGLSKIRIRGRWNPYLYNNDQGYDLIRTISTDQMCSDLGVATIDQLMENVDYVKVYIPCEENTGYVYIKSEIDKLKYDENEEQNGVLITRNEKPVKVWYQNKEENKQGIYIYNREYFKDEFRNNMESVELQVNNFENFKLSILNAEEEDDTPIPIEDIIHEYQWQNCNISVISSSNNFNNIAVDDDVNICYHTLDFNSNKRLLFFDGTDWKSSRILSTEISCRITDINGDEQILKRKIPLGKFYIVEDENLVTSTVSNFINHINSDIKDRKILDKFESLTAKKRFAIDIDKNLNSYNLSLLPEYAKTKMNVFFDPNTMRPYEANDYYFTKLNGETLNKGNYRIINEGEEYYKWSRTIADVGTSVGQSVNINKDNFPFNFKLIGETYIRNRYGEDYHYQIELYNCAILDNININLASTGEPTVVNIKMKALTDQGGDIGRLTIYRHQNTRINPRTGAVETTNSSDDILLRKKKLKKVLRAAAQNRSESDIDIIVNNLIKDQEQQKKYVPLDVLERVPILHIDDRYEIRILHPEENTIFCLEHDCAVPIVQEVDYTYLRLIVPDNEDWKNKNYEDYYEEIKNTLEKEDLLIAKVNSKGIIQGFVGNKDLEIEPYFSN